MSPHLLKNSDGTLQSSYRLALLDLDGVVYRGKNAVAHAASSIDEAAKAGMTITYTTNNPSRTAKTVADQIASFGISVAPSQIITSALVAARMLRHDLPAGAKVYVCGGEPLKAEVRAHGLTVVPSADDRPDAVIAGWFPDLGWKSLAQACIAIEHGARFYATNRDLTLPREEGITPGIGAFVNAIVAATGKQPIAMAGKPESAMYDEEREICAEDGEPLIPVSASLPIGDRLDTDIEAANRGGYDSLCVLTGVTDARQLLLAGPILRPTFISADLRGLAQAHEAPKAVPGTAGQKAQEAQGTQKAFELNGQRASFDEGHQAIVLSGPDSLRSLDALRCACQLCWTLADAGIDASALDLPEFEL